MRKGKTVATAAILGALIAFVSGSTALAHRQYGDRATLEVPESGDFTVDVLVDGKPLSKIHHDGKTFVEAPIATDFTLKLTCPNRGRFLAICSVDGLSVMTGKDASSADPGYILENGSLTIPGYRLDKDHVAHFRFGKRDDSYAAKMGKPKNIGVIAAKIFAERGESLPVTQLDSYIKPRSDDYPLPDFYYNRQEREPSWIYPTYSAPPVSLNPPLLPSTGTGAADLDNYGAEGYCAGGPPPYTSFINDPSFGASSLTTGHARLDPGVITVPPPSSTVEPRLNHDIGTEFGQKTDFNTESVAFKKGAQLATIVIEYASHDKLIAAGIVDNSDDKKNDPNPFPADTSYSCPPPPGWKG